MNLEWGPSINGIRVGRPGSGLPVCERAGRVSGRTVSLYGMLSLRNRGEFLKATEGELREAGRTEQVQADSWSLPMQEVMN